MKLLTKQEFNHADFDLGKNIAGFTFPIAESRAKLFELLTKNEARGFISCMVANLESMKKFTGVIDKIYNRSKRRRK